LDLRVFESENSDLPDEAKITSVERDQENDKYSTVIWEPSKNADGYPVRFGYHPSFLNLCIQVRHKKISSLFIHITTKGIKYQNRVDMIYEENIL